MREKLEINAPTADDMKIIEDVESVKQIVAGVRTVRNQKNIPNKDALKLQTVSENKFNAYDSIVLKMANLESIDVVAEKDSTAAAFMAAFRWSMVNCLNSKKSFLRIKVVVLFLAKLQHFPTNYVSLWK